jgi:hypothetical protein
MNTIVYKLKLAKPEKKGKGTHNSEVIKRKG